MEPDADLRDAIYATRLDLVEFLIGALADVPSEAFLESLLEGEIEPPSTGVDEDIDRGFDLLERFVEENRDRSPDAVRDDLAVEYTRLFVGPRPPAMPHESYHREDADFLGKAVTVLEADYGAAGWSPPEDYPEESDHVAVELAFLRYLIEAQREGREEALGYERVFHEEHLSRWIDDFASDTVDLADGPFYEAVGHLLRGFVAFEGDLAEQAR
ncbi:molecular chaperone [Natrialbaceae archaeon GCM10025810]|uniref:TorD/DmsD family molecular chaperone n=1 Tax=Halovalidus salilacus TaxID=3075124 RepID=UPI003614A844